MPRRPHDNTVARPFGRTSPAKKPTVAFATLQFGRSWCHDYRFLVAVCAVVRRARRICAPPQDESTPDVLDPPDVRRDKRPEANPVSPSSDSSCMLDGMDVLDRRM